MVDIAVQAECLVIDVVDLQARNACVRRGELRNLVAEKVEQLQGAVRLAGRRVAGNQDELEA